MKRNTIADYERAIKARYSEIISSGQADALLLEPTPAGLKRLCLLKTPELTVGDMTAYKRFFTLKENGDVYNQVDNFETPKFKALCNFLAGDSGKTAIERLELLAVLLDFNPRPYNKFSIAHDFQMVNEPTPVYGKENEEGDPEEKMNEEVLESTVTSSVQDIYPENPDRKAAVIPQKFFATPVRQNNTRANRIKLSVLIVLMLFAGVYFIISIFREKGCMMWKGDHYEEVPCDLEVNPVAENKVIPIKRDLLLYQKKIIPTDTTTFFNPDREARIFYGRGASKEYEYFTYPGKHPETRNDLKPITRHIISNHIKKEH